MLNSKAGLVLLLLLIFTVNYAETSVENRIRGAVSWGPVAVNVTEEAASPVLALTVLAPAVGPSVSVACAWPAASVNALPADKLPPPPVTAKVTVMPAIGSSLVSLTDTTNGIGSAVATGALWSFPESIWMLAIGPVIGTGAVHPAASTTPNNPIPQMGIRRLDTISVFPRIVPIELQAMDPALRC